MAIDYSFHLTVDRNILEMIIIRDMKQDYSGNGYCIPSMVPFKGKPIMFNYQLAHWRHDLIITCL